MKLIFALKFRDRSCAICKHSSESHFSDMYFCKMLAQRHRSHKARTCGMYISKKSVSKLIRLK